MPISITMEEINSKIKSVRTAINRLGLSRGIKVVEGVADVHAASTTSSSVPGGAVDVARSVAGACGSTAEQGGVKVVFTDEGAKDRFLQEIHVSLVAPAASAVTSAAVSANKLIKWLLHSFFSTPEAKEYSITLNNAECNRLYDYAVWSKLEEHNRKQREIELILNISDVVSFFAMVVGGVLMATGFGFLPGLLLVTLGGLGFVGTALASKPASIIREAVSIEDKAEDDKNPQNPQHYKRRKQILEAIGWLRLLDVGIYVYDRPILDCKLEYNTEPGEGKPPVKLVFENDPRAALESSGILGEFSKQVELDGASKKYVIQLTKVDCDRFIEALQKYHESKLDKKARIHAVLAKFVRITASLVGIAGLVLMFIVPPIGSPMVVMSGLLLGGAHWVTDPNKANGGILEKVAGWLKKAHISEVNFMRFNIVFATFSIVSGVVLMATGAGFAIGFTMMIFGIASLPGPILFIENAKVISDIDKLSQSAGQANELTREEQRKEEQQKLELKVRRHMGVAKIVRIIAILLGIGGVVLTFFAPPVGVQMIIVAGVLLGGAHWVIGPGIAGGEKNKSVPDGSLKGDQSVGNRNPLNNIGNWLKILQTDEVNFMRLSIVLAALSIIGGAALVATGFGFVAGLTMMVFGVATLLGPTLFVKNARVISDKDSLLRPISKPQKVSDVPPITPANTPQPALIVAGAEENLQKTEIQTVAPASQSSNPAVVTGVLLPKGRPVEPSSPAKTLQPILVAAEAERDLRTLGIQTTVISDKDSLSRPINQLQKVSDASASHILDKFVEAARRVLPSPPMSPELTGMASFPVDDEKRDATTPEVAVPPESASSPTLFVSGQGDMPGQKEESIPLLPSTLAPH